MSDDRHAIYMRFSHRAVNDTQRMAITEKTLARSET
jgi:hypothetical protein